MIKCFLDCESTGVDPYNDRIVEVKLMRRDPEGAEQEVFSTLVNPGIPIPPDATAIHQITDEMLSDAPTFADIVARVEAMTCDAVLIGYNSRRFDIPLLHAEMKRCGAEGFPLDEFGAIDVPEIDLYKVWMEKERRTLTSAAYRFAQIDHREDAHSASKDTDVLPEILAGMRGEFDISDDEMIEVTAPNSEVDRDGRFAKNDEGKMIFNFGKHIGKPVSRNIGYIEWMLKADFSTETHAWCRRFLAWSGK